MSEFDFITAPVLTAQNALFYGAIALASVLIAISFLWFGRVERRGRAEESRIARIAIRRFIISIALPVLILLGAPLILVAVALGADGRMLQALVAGIVIATGWLTTSIFSELEQKRARSEQLRDYHKAIYAEIRTTLDGLFMEGQADGFARQLVERMRADPGFIPFIPLETHDRLFGALVDKIEVLPRQTIDSITAYYSLITSMTSLAQDMRSPAFASETMSQERRIAVYEDYVSLRVRALSMGEATLKVINAYAQGGASAADEMLARLGRAEVAGEGANNGAANNGGGRNGGANGGLSTPDGGPASPSRETE